jgi:hypothetical protein
VYLIVCYFRNVIHSMVECCNINNADSLRKPDSNYRCVRVWEGLKKSNRGEAPLVYRLEQCGAVLQYDVWHGVHMGWIFWSRSTLVGFCFSCCFQVLPPIKHAFTCVELLRNIVLKCSRRVREFASRRPCHSLAVWFYFAGETVLKSKPSWCRLIWMSLSVEYVWIILSHDVRLRYLRNKPLLAAG